MREKKGATVLDGAVTWRPTPEGRSASQLQDFALWVEVQHGVRTSGYRDLHDWSVTDPNAFWSAVREYFAVIGEGFDGPALADERMPGAVWFPEARLNFAENVLRPAHDPGSQQRVALREVLETGPGRTWTWAELSSSVAGAAEGLRRLGVGAGDRVAAVLPNVPEAVIGLLATAAVGATWCIASPDMAPAAIVGRMAQLEPVVLLGTGGYRFGGRRLDRVDHLSDVRAGLPSVRRTVLVDWSAGPRDDAVEWPALVVDGAPLRFERVPFDHPLWVLFSSGTTGVPKGIVQGHGGILLEGLKLAGLQHDLRPDDLCYIAANTSWMVWNLLVMYLTSGAGIVVYPGSPVLGNAAHLFEIIAQERVTAFGTGAAYLRAVQAAGAAPGRDLDLSRLRRILSTGSTLPDSTWRWVHDAVRREVQLGSDSGGTDICSAFLGSNPIEPVHLGWLQGAMLGAAVEVWNERGERVFDEVGEMVVTRPMPSMPVRFWDDPDGATYRAAYFEDFPGAWRHGDWVLERRTGEFQVAGRSDATLNRGGVRIGSADIYGALEAVHEVRESLVIGVELPGGGYWFPLFVQLRDGAVLDAALEQRIRTAIRSATSARHVPEQILQVPAIPLTHAQKRIEVPIKRLFLGMPVEKAVNRGSLADPAALDWFVERAATFRAHGPEDGHDPR